MRNRPRRVLCALILLCWVPLSSSSLFAYSVLSHQALIDALWTVAIRPLLLARFPGATPEQLKEAHAYAYGGSIIQDMGFYPHGNGYFSDLTHYVRAGDFIEALIANAHTLDEAAFAIGALSHYAADCDGHRYGTNISEPKLYPNLGKKYGAAVTYGDDPAKHLKTEYAFDVLEVAKGNFAPEAYHDFIGFEVATPLLETAFRQTYGLDMVTFFEDLPEAIGSYRRTVSTLVPLATRVAWAQHKNDIKIAQPGATRRRFVYIMRRSSYEREWGKRYDRPTLIDRILSHLLRFLPPIGPLATLRFKALTPETEKDFMHSFDMATQTYKGHLSQVGAPDLHLADQNFDLGSATPPGAYRLQDDTYAYWLAQLAQTHFAGLSPPIQAALLAYYRDLNAPFSTKKRPKAWRELLVQLNQLRSAPIQAASSPAPLLPRNDPN